MFDVRQTFAPDALERLVAPFADLTVSAVSGILDIAPSPFCSSCGIGLYWELETRVRNWEGQLDYVIGCTGTIDAIRRDLYTPIPENTHKKSPPQLTLPTQTKNP